MKGSRRQRRLWFWRFRKGAPAAYIEETEDGLWRIVVDRAEIARVNSREIAVALVDQLDNRAAR